MLPLVVGGERGRDGDGGNDWPDQAGVFGGQEADPPDRARAADLAENRAQGGPGIGERVWGLSSSGTGTPIQASSSDKASGLRSAAARHGHWNRRKTSSRP